MSGLFIIFGGAGFGIFEKILDLFDLSNFFYNVYLLLFKLQNWHLLFQFLNFLTSHWLFQQVLIDFGFLLLQFFVDFIDFVLEDFVFEVLMLQIVYFGVNLI